MESSMGVLVARPPPIPTPRRRNKMKTPIIDEAEPTSSSMTSSPIMIGITNSSNVPIPAPRRCRYMSEGSNMASPPTTNQQGAAVGGDMRRCERMRSCSTSTWQLNDDGDQHGSSYSSQRVGKQEGATPQNPQPILLYSPPSTQDRLAEPSGEKASLVDEFAQTTAHNVVNHDQNHIEATTRRSTNRSAEDSDLVKLMSFQSTPPHNMNRHVSSSPRGDILGDKDAGRIKSDFSPKQQQQSPFLKLRRPKDFIISPPAKDSKKQQKEQEQQQKEEKKVVLRANNNSVGEGVKKRRSLRVLSRVLSDRITAENNVFKLRKQQQQEEEEDMTSRYASLGSVRSRIEARESPKPVVETAYHSQHRHRGIKPDQVSARIRRFAGDGNATSVEPPSSAASRVSTSRRTRVEPRCESKREKNKENEVVTSQRIEAVRKDDVVMRSSDDEDSNVKVEEAAAISTNDNNSFVSMFACASTPPQYKNGNARCEVEDNKKVDGEATGDNYAAVRESGRNDVITTRLCSEESGDGEEKELSVAEGVQESVEESTTAELVQEQAELTENQPENIEAQAENMEKQPEKLEEQPESVEKQAEMREEQSEVAVEEVSTEKQAEQAVEAQETTTRREKQAEPTTTTSCRQRRRQRRRNLKVDGAASGEDYTSSSSGGNTTPESPCVTSLSSHPLTCLATTSTTSSHVTSRVMEDDDVIANKEEQATEAVQEIIEDEKVEEEDEKPETESERVREEAETLSLQSHPESSSHEKKEEEDVQVNGEEKEEEENETENLTETIVEAEQEQEEKASAQDADEKPISESKEEESEKKQEEVNDEKEGEQNGENEKTNKDELTLDRLHEIEDIEFLNQMFFDPKYAYEDRRLIRQAIRKLKAKQAGKPTPATSTAANTKTYSYLSSTKTTKTSSASGRVGAAQTTVKKSSTESTKSATPKSLASKYGLTDKSRVESYTSRSATNSPFNQRKMTSTLTQQPKKIGSIFDREEDDSIRRSRERKQAERKRNELQRIRSMPASSSSSNLSRDSAARNKFVAQLEATSEHNNKSPGKKVGRATSSVVPQVNNIRQRLLRWATVKTSKYPGVDVHNYSSSWADGLAFCALVHAYFPSAFDFHQLTPHDRAHNFELAFSTAEKEGGASPLLDVADMLYMGDRPDPKCVFTYLQSLYSKFTKLERPIKEGEGKKKLVMEKTRPSLQRSTSQQLFTMTRRPTIARQKSLIVEETDCL